MGTLLRAVRHCSYSVKSSGGELAMVEAIRNRKSQPTYMGYAAIAQAADVVGDGLCVDPMARCPSLYSREFFWFHRNF